MIDDDKPSLDEYLEELQQDAYANGYGDAHNEGYQSGLAEGTYRALWAVAVMAAVFMLLLCSGLARGAEYTYSGGYYWSNGKCYTRTVAKSGGYQYTPVVQIDATKAVAKKDWREQLLDAKKLQIAYEAAQQKQLLEQQHYLEALQALGFSSGNYGAGFAAAQSPAYGGNSIYGYSYSQIADYYGQSSPNVLLNQYANTTDRAFDLAGRASDNTKELISTSLAGAERVATINAETQRVLAVLQGAAEVAEKSRTAHTRIETRFSGQNATPTSSIVPATPAPTPANLSVLTTRCATCHTGESAPLGLVLDGSAALSVQQFERAWTAIKVARGEASREDTGVKPMPEESPLTDSEQLAAFAELAGLVQ